MLLPLLPGGKCFIFYYLPLTFNVYSICYFILVSKPLYQWKSEICNSLTSPSHTGDDTKSNTKWWIQKKYTHNVERTNSKVHWILWNLLTILSNFSLLDDSY